MKLKWMFWCFMFDMFKGTANRCLDAMNKINRRLGRMNEQEGRQ